MPSCNRLRRARHSAGGCDGCAIARWRGATPHPRSGAESGRTPCPKGSGQEEIPSIRGQGRRSGGAIPRPHTRGQGRRLGGATHAGGQGWQREELPGAGAVAAQAQEGLEELSHVEG